MPHEDKREDRCEDRLSVALSFLSREVSRLTDQLERTTNQEVILNRIAKLETNLTMKLSEIKTAIAEAAANSREAFAELATKIADLQKQIDDLIAGNSDPDVTDEAFLADLQSLRTDAANLAAIVPNVPPVEPPVEPASPA